MKVKVKGEIENEEKINGDSYVAGIVCECACGMRSKR